ncbi:MAG: glycosyltransferase family 2 protein, partial [Rhodoglobus sp.]
MQPSVTAILVARNGADYLSRTLSALAAQTRPPDSVVFVDAGSTDSSAEQLVAAGPTQLVTTPGTRSFGGAIAHAVQVAAPQPSGNDWLWLLAHDNAPEPGALAALLGAVEIAPSVALAGPKLMRWDEPDTIAAYGETVTRLGASVLLVENELDQAQHDLQNDLLGVSASGMLVRREVWSVLGGFDPALPSVDAALDFSIRARLAGHRVVGVPSARVASAGPPELFGRRSVGAGTTSRLRRAAQLHRRFVYAPALALPIHWLSLLPLAIIRSIGHLIGKRPGAIPGEIGTAIAGAFDGRVRPARRNIRRTKKASWAAIAPLRMPLAEARELRASRRAVSASGGGGEGVERPGFLRSGGAWVVLLAALIGVLAFSPFLGATSLSGGGLIPLSSQFVELWSHVGYGWRDIGAGFVGAADPFAYVLAVLGSLTFWAPSFSIVLFYLVCIPLAALAAWSCAARFAQRGWGPAIAALLWALAPPFLASLTGGHLGAAIAHVLLPWLVLATVNAARSWSLSAVAALLFAAVAASAPILVPALLVAWLAWMASKPTSIHRLIGIPIPAAALFAPLVIQQLQRGNWLALVAEPGLPVAGGTSSGWQLALGSPAENVNGWVAFAAAIGLPATAAPIVVAVLLAPLGAVALLALFLPGSRRAIPAMVIALLGFATAVIGAHIEVSIVGASTVPVWPAAGLSLYWLGLLGAAVAAFDALGRAVTVPALVVGIAGALVVAPFLAAPITGTSQVTAGSGRLLPAFVTAEAAQRPSIGTLELVAQDDGGVSATVHRGAGTTLDEQSTLSATATSLSA